VLLPKVSLLACARTGWCDPELARAAARSLLGVSWTFRRVPNGRQPPVFSYSGASGGERYQTQGRRAPVHCSHWFS